MPKAPQIHPDASRYFQIPRADLTHWSLFRYAEDEDPSGPGERLSYELEGVSVREFPIGDLSVETIRERFGVGLFRVGWLRVVGTKRYAHGRSPVVAIGVQPACAPVEAPAPAAPAPAAPEGMALAFGMIREMRAYAADELSTVERAAQERIQAIVALANAFRAPAPAVPDPAIGAALQSIAATLASIDARVSALEGDDEGDEEDEDEDEDDEPEQDGIDRFIAKAERLAPIVLGAAEALKQRAEAPPAPAPAPSLAPAPAPSSEPVAPSTAAE